MRVRRDTESTDYREGKEREEIKRHRDLGRKQSIKKWWQKDREGEGWKERCW